MRAHYWPSLTRKGWRIIQVENGYERDVCGAVDEVVARQQCAILNDGRR